MVELLTQSLIQVNACKLFIGELILLRIAKHTHQRSDMIRCDLEWLTNNFQHAVEVTLIDKALPLCVLAREQQLDRLHRQRVPFEDPCEDFFDQRSCDASCKLHGQLSVFLELLDVDPLFTATVVQLKLAAFF